ncbi:alpha-hydroxy-acid oxidizing protein [Actinomadura sp. HBU206391]|uniref:alpha-hydroxy-acid oxidizing protein n=1 Tax=Actinomadura sp. HBU206391 TaxID=2731692 RepID=UPI00164F9C08|nr:alpha-hydroxy-acid oxidizing protein [Actinomadura sp. HBU206391]MBC6459032.1 alpha-hydroxy-acid oxidizing protein [Actinomadura sp. HBU206391]
MSSPADFQNEIYLNGLGDVLPGLPTDLTRLERLARKRLSPGAHGYVAGSAGGGATARANRAAFDRWRIVPRMLRDVAVRDVAVEVLGASLPAPVLLGPVGVLSIVHPGGEPAVARAASALSVPMVLSSAASHTIEEVAEASGDGPRWFQLYWPKDPEIAASFLGRAKAAGYTALVVTLDTSILGWRPRDLDQAFLPFLRGIGVANYFSDPAFLKGIGGSLDADRAAAIMHWAANFGNPALTWDDLGFLREHWDGPIVLKGIQHADDARQAADAGMDGVIVSNHGGRQVDGAVASLDVLPDVVAAVGEQITVLFDSGIRSGSDMVKALALGARAVLIARPYVYGLGLAGEAGVQHVLRCLMAEFELTLALSGVVRPGDLTPDILRRADA